VTPDPVDRLFAALSQADTPLTRQPGGTGRGLTITPRFARLLGRDVTLEWTKPANASRFRLLLPLVRAQGTADVSTLGTVARDLRVDLPVESPTLAGCTEDGAVNPRLIAVQLREAGADVHPADTARIALDAVDQVDAEGRPYDMLVTTMQIPEMDGDSGPRTLRERDGDRRAHGPRHG